MDRSNDEAAPDVLLERARPEHADVLTTIAFAAKAHWGYPQSWLRAWSRTLTIEPQYIATHPTYLAKTGDHIVGFCAIVIEGREAALDHLWVDPRHISRGIGRTLFVQAEHAARSAGCISITIVADPHAEGFYLRMGGRRCGEEAAPVNGQGRALPILQKSLA